MHSFGIFFPGIFLLPDELVDVGFGVCSDRYRDRSVSHFNVITHIPIKHETSFYNTIMICTTMKHKKDIIIFMTVKYYVIT